MQLQDVINPEFNLKKHALALKAQLFSNDLKMKSIDGQRIYIVFFILNSLDMMNMIDEQLSQEDKQRIISWIYNLQIIKRTKQSNTLIGGFRGSPINGFYTEKQTNVQTDNSIKVQKQQQMTLDQDEKTKVKQYENNFQEEEIEEDEIHQDESQIVFTQCALASLLIMGDDLQGVSRVHLQQTLKRLQDSSSGRIRACESSEEQDIRFVYSSLLIGRFLNDFSHIDCKLAMKTILACQNQQDGAFGLSPQRESHGGSTFCAIASLRILDQINQIPHLTKLIHWLTNRQQLLTEQAQQLPPDEQIQIDIISLSEYENELNQKKELNQNINKKPSVQKDEFIGKSNVDIENNKQQSSSQSQKLECVGMQGRVNKFPDSCYTTWIGGSLQILGFGDMLVKTNVSRFLKLCEYFHGGFQKYPFDTHPDPVHTHFSIIGLNLLNAMSLDRNQVDFSLLLKKVRLP